MSAIDDLVKLLKRERRTGTDYVGTVTRVEGNTAYVQLTGSDIADTPVSMTINANVGDRVRVRVNGGKAWITGNDTLPPSNEKAEVSKKMSKDMSNRVKDITIKDGVIRFVGDTIVIESKNFKLDEEGNGTFSGNLSGAGGTFTGTLQGADYVDSTSNFSMDIGTHEEDGVFSPAFTIGGYINGDPSNQYLMIDMTVMYTDGDTYPQLYIGATIKDSPEATDEKCVSIGIGDLGTDFYASTVENGELTRLHSSIPWGYNPW